MSVRNRLGSVETPDCTVRELPVPSVLAPAGSIATSSDRVDVLRALGVVVLLTVKTPVLSYAPQAVPALSPSIPSHRGQSYNPERASSSLRKKLSTSG